MTSAIYDMEADIELNADVDWRDEIDEGDVDDEESEETTDDVIALLGFDPVRGE